MSGHDEVVSPRSARLGQDRANDLVERHLGGLLLSIAVLESAMLVRNALVLSFPGRVVLPLLQAVFVILALSLWGVVRHHPASHAQSQRYIAIALVAFGVLIPLEQALTGHGLLAANLGLIMVAAGVVIVSTRAYVVSVVILLASWAVALSTRGQWDVSAADQGLLLVAAIFLASLLHMVRVSDRDSLVDALDEAVKTALRDQLTGLWNRRGALEMGQRMISEARRDGAAMWCLFFDIRGLKAVNDRLGHAQGDALLVGVGDALEFLGDDEAFAVRWGGDEFCLIGMGSAPVPEHFARSLESDVLGRIGAIDQSWGITPGLSLSEISADPDFIHRLVDSADADMYRRRREEIG